MQPGNQLQPEFCCRPWWKSTPAREKTHVGAKAAVSPAIRDVRAGTPARARAAVPLTRDKCSYPGDSWTKKKSPLVATHVTTRKAPAVTASIKSGQKYDHSAGGVMVRAFPIHELPCSFEEKR